ncbi:hypothetical protein [Chryseobacterium gambrini]|uniref:Helix-turn-helix domain-containing protein n=1 Tax=Chryseobacterium gambrini TaxID=373672 RepID=A0ABM8KCK9_9FLAO|nr:helix-turn-helix domain-containing protein [Chryseobacterium gambrini]
MKKYTEGNFEDEFAPHLGFTKKLIIEIPFEILSNQELSLNEKLMLGLDFSLKKKLGFNQMTNKKIGEILSLHPNIVGYCRKNLLEKQYLLKKGRQYFLTDHYKSIQELEINNAERLENKDRRNIKLPIEIYSHKELKTGVKLLWGEYNSISKSIIEYFAKREYTAKRLNVSVESISNWTKALYEKGLLEEYRVKSGYCTRQKIIITCSFDKK